MARKLRHLVQPIKQQLASLQQLRLPASGPEEAGELPPLLQVQLQRGEALLVHSFYEFLDQVGQVSPELQLKAWEQIIARGEPLIDLAQRTGLSQRFASPLDAVPEKSAYKSWCLLLFYLNQNPDSRAWKAATEGFYRHYFASLFPRDDTVIKNVSAEQLKKQALRLLRKRWKQNVDIKESFKEHTDKERTGQLVFTLRVKIQNLAWQELMTCTGQRLKPTRQHTYQQLIKQLEAGEDPLPSRFATQEEVLRAIG